MDPRRAAWYLVTGLLAPVALGLALTASLFGAIFGIPLLALVLPPWWQSLRVLRGKSSFTRVGSAWALAAALVLTAALATALAIGIEDLDIGVDLAALVVGVGLLAVTWLGARRARASVST